MDSIWHTRVIFRLGDLADAHVDAIVNAANNELLLGAGVAGAIRRKGGPSIQDDCNRIGSIRIGEAAITSGGNLAAKHVIHAASMQLGGCTTERSLRDATRSTLDLAEANHLKSLAFPAIGTGIAGFPVSRCAEIMLGAIRQHLSGPSTLERVEFVLFDQPTLKAFERVFAHLTE